MSGGRRARPQSRREMKNFVRKVPRPLSACQSRVAVVVGRGRERQRERETRSVCVSECVLCVRERERAVLVRGHWRIGMDDRDGDH